jgi:PRC-barrel domain
MLAAVDYGNRISYLVLEQGADVVSSDGKVVGKLERVLADGDADIFDGLIIDVQPGPGGQRFADSEQVADIYERAVILTVPADQVEQLPPPSANY